MIRTQRRAAQALVELALALPVVLTLSLGVLQVVLYAHARDVLTSAVQEGARLAAEDGRTVDEGVSRAQALVAAGLGSSLDGVQFAWRVDPEVVALRIESRLRPLVPVPTLGELPIRVEAQAARERFRPGGSAP